jgi:hypothetical protein
MTPFTDIPAETIAWLSDVENPAVAVMTRRELLGEAESEGLAALWARRNDYAPVAEILAEFPALVAAQVRGYQKYRGPLWQVHFLGELWADGTDERVQQVAEYAFSHQLASGAWTCSGNGSASGAIPCLTANVGRALARMGWARDERVVRGLAFCADVVRENGGLACPPGGTAFTLNGYCHMVAPKLLLFLGEVPSELWPAGAEEMRDECVRVLRAREIYQCLPNGARAFQDIAYERRHVGTDGLREAWIAENGPLEYGHKPGWLRFGHPLSYNSDALESLAALAAVGETARPEYGPALDLVRSTADDQMRWRLRNTFNGKTVANIEKKGQPSKWLTLRALQVLRHFDADRAEGVSAG